MDADTANPKGRSRRSDLRCPGCRAVSWEGEHRAYVERLRDGRVVADAAPDWRPGAPWRCQHCDIILSPASTSPSAQALDAAVVKSLGEQRVRLRHARGVRSELNRALRLEYIAGAEEHSRQVRGRGLTADELRLVLQQYPGDLPTDVTPSEP